MPTITSYNPSYYGVDGARGEDAKTRLQKLASVPVNPAPTCQRIDIPKYMTKTNPQQRSPEFFRRLLQYTNVARDFHVVEDMIVKLRVSTMAVERMILEEELKQQQQQATTKPKPSVTLLRHRLQYMEMVKDLRAAEQSAVKHRAGMARIELSILDEEEQYANERTQFAESLFRRQLDYHTRLSTILDVGSGSDTDSISTTETVVSTGSTLLSTSPSKGLPSQSPRRREARVNRDR